MSDNSKESLGNNEDAIEEEFEDGEENISEDETEEKLGSLPMKEEVRDLEEKKNRLLY